MPQGTVISVDNKIVPSVCTATHTVRLLIDARAWPHYSTDESEHIAGMISRIALQHSDLTHPGITQL